jgi:5'-nucleotidase
MTTNTDIRLMVALSSRALFDLEDSHKVCSEQGLEAYQQYQIEHENDVLGPGVAFPLVRKLLALNLMEPDEVSVEVVLISRNSPDTGLRVFNSIQHHGLDIERAAFTDGDRPFRYLKPFGVHLFLSANPDDVREAINQGFAAATIFPGDTKPNSDTSAPLSIAFDGDAVIFSDVAEKVAMEEGVQAFNESEKSAAKAPLPDGPFKGFLSVLHLLQVHYPSKSSPIRTALVTARGSPAHERAIRTLRAWNIRIDEALFLGGMEKGVFLDAFGADIFFDDQEGHCQSARKYVTTGHVPYGVKN